MSNKYCQALVELRNKPAHELKEVGDQWRTPDNIFWGINTLFGPFVLDLFTDGDNAKCAAYYTAEDNALAHDWSLEKKGVITIKRGVARGITLHTAVKDDDSEAVWIIRSLLAGEGNARLRAANWLHERGLKV